MSGRKSSGMWIEQLGEECSLDRTLHPGESWWRVSTELGKWCLGSVPIRISPPILSWQSSNWGICSYFYHNWKYPLLEGLKSGSWVLGVEYSISILNILVRYMKYYEHYKRLGLNTSKAICRWLLGVEYWGHCNTWHICPDLEANTRFTTPTFIS